MVKKHSNSLGKTIVDEPLEADATDDVEFDPRFWHDVFDLYFVRGKEPRGRQDDDLLFFVRKLVCLFAIFPERNGIRSVKSLPFVDLHFFILSNVVAIEFAGIWFQ